MCRPSYSFPASISPIDSTAIYDKSLYEAEESGNKFETELIQAITGLPNIRWWHRNIARTGFAINGFINHYPDFIVRTRSGKIVIIETKGDHLANEETLAKLHLGRAWQEQAGPGYRYFLVFQDKDISMTGALPGATAPQRMRPTLGKVFLCVSRNGRSRVQSRAYHRY